MSCGDCPDPVKYKPFTRKDIKPLALYFAIIVIVVLLALWLVTFFQRIL